MTAAGAQLARSLCAALELEGFKTEYFASRKLHTSPAWCGGELGRSDWLLEGGRNMGMLAQILRDTLISGLQPHRSVEAFAVLLHSATASAAAG